MLLLNSCEGPVGPQGPSGNDGGPGPKLTGSISGYVYLVNPDTIYNDNSGVRIQIENTLFETITNSSGKWKITDLQTGIYNILISKSGYTNFKYNSVQFVGGGDYIIGTRYLASPPEIFITIDTVYSHPFGVTIHGQRLNDIEGAQSYYGMIFWGADNSVSANPGHYNFTSDLLFNYNSYTYSLSISKNNFYNAGFKSGDRIYVTIYGTISWSNSFYGLMFEQYFRYIDLNTNKYVFPYLGEKSETFSIEIP